MLHFVCHGSLQKVLKIWTLKISTRKKIESMEFPREENLDPRNTHE